MSVSEGREIREVLDAIDAYRTLEVGLAYGMSTLHICEAIRDKPDARHIAIDPLQTTEFDGIGLLNLERAGLRHLLDFYEEPSHECLPKLLGAGVELDFALIDGAHLFDCAFVDFFYIDKMLRPEGIICMDDMWLLAIQKVVKFFLRNRGYTIARGMLPSAIGAKVRRTVKRLIGQDNFRALRRALGRGRGERHGPSATLLFLQKPEHSDVPDWSAEYVVDF